MAITGRSPLPGNRCTWPPFPAIELASKPSALAITHGGHGVNSYALAYVVGFEAIGVFTQVPWGGAFMDAQQ
jgi:hypothetical protein